MAPFFIPVIDVHHQKAWHSKEKLTLLMNSKSQDKPFYKWLPSHWLMRYFTLRSGIKKATQ